MSNIEQGQALDAIDRKKEEGEVRDFLEKKLSTKRKLRKARKRARRYKEKCRKLKKQKHVLQEQLETSQKKIKDYKEKVKMYREIIRRERYQFGMNPFVELDAALKAPRSSKKGKNKGHHGRFPYLELPDYGSLPYGTYYICPGPGNRMKQPVLDADYRECTEDKR